MLASKLEISNMGVNGGVINKLRLLHHLFWQLQIF